jgi:glutathione S-transferase
MRAAVLNSSLRGKTWLVGEQLTIADFSIGAFVPSAERIELPVRKITEILRWYKGLAALPAWRDAMAAKDAAMAVCISKRAG